MRTKQPQSNKVVKKTEDFHIKVTSKMKKLMGFTS